MDQNDVMKDKNGKKKKERDEGRSDDERKKKIKNLGNGGKM